MIKEGGHLVTTSSPTTAVKYDNSGSVLNPGSSEVGGGPTAVAAVMGNSRRSSLKSSIIGGLEMDPVDPGPQHTVNPLEGTATP